MFMEKKYNLENLDCANCAAKLENDILKISNVEDATVAFMTKNLTISYKSEFHSEIMSALDKVMKKHSIRYFDKDNKELQGNISANIDEHSHEHAENCSCTHEHSHDEHSHEHAENCSCTHEHSHDEHSHEHAENCSCTHEHSHDEHSHEHAENCSCTHEHSHDEHSHEHAENCSCTHEHSHDDGCNCGHDHSYSEFDKNSKTMIMRLTLSFALLLGGVFSPEMTIVKFVLFFASYIVAGGDVLLGAFKNIIKGQIFDENFLMSIATIGAFAIGEYPEGVAVMLFFQIGELFQGWAVNKSRKSISSLMDIRPDHANVIRNNIESSVDPQQVKLGEYIAIKTGEKVPLDAVIMEGFSSLDTSALTGESMPRDVKVGDSILSGSINLGARIVAKAEKEYKNSTVSKILELVETSSSKKSKAEKFITKFARYYTPIVVLIATLIAILPPLLMQGAIFSDWLYRALVFLVISCPCALVISVPLSFFGGIGGASKAGILVKGGNYLETLANAKIVVFDKTGTLTKGEFSIEDIVTNDISKDELLKFATLAQKSSIHPIAKCLKNAYNKKDDNIIITNSQDIAGKGVKANIDGKEIAVGNVALMSDYSIIPSVIPKTTAIFVAIDGKYAGYITLTDTLKDDSAKAISELKSLGIKETIILSGDSQEAVLKVSNIIKVDKIYTKLLPSDKVNKFEEILKNSNAKEKVIFVGDGINDAPVLARADVGVAMGGLGSDAAIEAADIVIMNDEPTKLVTAIKIAKKTMNIVSQNIVFALGVKILVMILGAFGYASMWTAVFADVGVSVIAILNAIRTLKIK